ncbi:CBASS cGAMP synthase [bacterium endosymbiont of Bathymodiolus sp. 5 South]|uniref:CBASS cGAMP synthase n=1 Tax=bacterium endosymbiont of Bathymodiolus sp. 5 South TaxID=1181670 RepID=UPI00111B15AA|nr:hypothetical protein [bacterium endosymbiont of Bathymodiolus sp. 5 South]
MNKDYDFNESFNKFRKKISLSDEDKKNFLESRELIRKTIRKTFNEKTENYFSLDDLKILTHVFFEFERSDIKPKFMTQGSFAYNTINTPENPPVQQMDLDDGIYFPLKYIEKASNGNFSQAAQTIRNIVYRCVNDLCRDMNWNLEKKSKCLRVTLDTSSHIDLPIYSAPEKEMKKITKTSLNSIMSTGSIDKFFAYEKLDDILLATDDGWLKSDPRVIQQWVEDNKQKRGRNFIHYSKYIKNWRDCQWKKDSGFSSIMVMAGISQAMSEYSYSENDNTALDLSSIVCMIKMYLDVNGDGILSPDNQERMDSELSNRNEIIKQLNKLSINLNESVSAGSSDFLTESFGSRFPSESVKPSKEAAPAIITNLNDFESDIPVMPAKKI